MWKRVPKPRPRFCTYPRNVEMKQSWCPRLIKSNKGIRVYQTILRCWWAADGVGLALAEWWRWRWGCKCRRRIPSAKTLPPPARSEFRKCKYIDWIRKETQGKARTLPKFSFPAAQCRFLCKHSVPIGNPSLSLLWCLIHQLTAWSRKGRADKEITNDDTEYIVKNWQVYGDRKERGSCKIMADAKTRALNFGIVFCLWNARFPLLMLFYKQFAQADDREFSVSDLRPSASPNCPNTMSQPNLARVWKVRPRSRMTKKTNSISSF